MGFLPWEIRVAFSGESQLRQSHATQRTVHAGCFSVSIIHRTLTWTTGSLTCSQMFMHAIAHRGIRTHVRESALKVDSGRKNPRRTGDSNLRQRCAGPTHYQLSYIPIRTAQRTNLKNDWNWREEYPSILNKLNTATWLITASLSRGLNELTRNLSEHIRPQSSQLAEPLSTDSGIKRWN